MQSLVKSSLPIFKWNCIQFIMFNCILEEQTKESQESRMKHGCRSADIWCSISSSPKVENTVGPAQQSSNQSIILLKILKRKNKQTKKRKCAKRAIECTA